VERKCDKFKPSVPLQHYIEALIKEKESYHKLHFRELQRALKLNKEQLDHRLQGLNELRKEVEKDRGEFIKRDAYELTKASNDKELEQLHTRLTIIETRSVTWSAALAVFIVVLQVVAWFLR
jgi:hypothetical protein